MTSNLRKDGDAHNTNSSKCPEDHSIKSLFCLLHNKPLIGVFKNSRDVFCTKCLQRQKIRPFFPLVETMAYSQLLLENEVNQRNGKTVAKSLVRSASNAMHVAKIRMEKMKMCLLAALGDHNQQYAAFREYILEQQIKDSTPFSRLEPGDRHGALDLLRKTDELSRRFDKLKLNAIKSRRVVFACFYNFLAARQDFLVCQGRFLRIHLLRTEPASSAKTFSFLSAFTLFLLEHNLLIENGDGFQLDRRRMEFSREPRIRFLNEPKSAHGLRIIAKLIPNLFDTVRKARHTYGLASRLEDYSAFPGVPDFAAVRTVLNAPLVRMGQVSVSEAVLIPFIPQAVKFVGILSLSNTGVLCAAHNPGNFVMVFDLVGRRLAVLYDIPCMCACVCDSKIFFFESGERTVRFAELEQVLREPSKRDMWTFTLCEPPELTPNLDYSSSEGWVLFPSSENPKNILVVSLYTHESNVFSIDREAVWLGGLTDIRIPGILCVASNTRRELFVIKDDGTTELLLAKTWEGPALLPSAKVHLHPRYGAFINDQSYIFFSESEHPFMHPLKPAACHCILRLYRDVFLCLDAASWEWRALRIAVP
eukprot:gnl/Chilomastix_cuspidata/1767.p1 GENE.gnl/Chilomastix_cuspidata/1767~~gnl/Chilomastix_cuspidata/1767.p1  ORF type:complete len:590 (-),score=212.19 gnl/Chilomastix_cuspidata/1767:793-2562(-)